MYCKKEEKTFESTLKITTYILFIIIIVIIIIFNYL